MNSKDKEDYLCYAKARNQSRNACRKAVREYENDITSELKRNPKHFCRYVKSKLNVRHGVTNLEREDITLIETDFNRAEVFNPFFKKSTCWTLEHRCQPSRIRRDSPAFSSDVPRPAKLDRCPAFFLENCIIIFFVADYFTFCLTPPAGSKWR